MIDEALLAELKKTLKHGADWEYFFDNLTSPDWASPLLEAGFFDAPEDLIVSDDGILAPDWHQEPI